MSLRWHGVVVDFDVDASSVPLCPHWHHGAPFTSAFVHDFSVHLDSKVGSSRADRDLNEGRVHKCNLISCTLLHWADEVLGAFG